MEMPRTGLTWIKSSYSSTDENCVELAVPGEAVLVRDSKDPEGGILRTTPATFRALLQSLVSV